MKKFYLSLVLAMVCVLGLEAQTPAELRAQFAQAIQTYQKNLPKKYDSGVKITQVEVTDSDFVMYIDVPDEQVGDFELVKGLSVNPDQLPSIVEEMRKTLPQDWGDGLSLTDLYLEKDNLVYKIKTDESVLTIELLNMVDDKDGEDVIKTMVLNEITISEDDGVKAFANTLIRAHLGIKVVFWSDQSVKRLTFFISPEEIESQVNAMR